MQHKLIIEAFRQAGTEAEQRTAADANNVLPHLQQTPCWL